MVFEPGEKGLSVKRLFAFTDDRSRARCLDDNGGTKLIQSSEMGVTRCADCK